MSSKGSALMKNAQTEKTRQTVEQFVDWYSKKEEFYKVYLPIQQTVIKRILNAAQTTFNRLRQIAQIMADQKELQSIIFQKTEKNMLSDETKFQPKVEQLIDPSDMKSKVKKETPIWSNNVDRVLLSLSKHQKERQGRIKKIFKVLETIQESILKQQGKYKGDIKKFEKDLDSSFNKIDDYQKQESKTLGKMIKENKSNDIKDSAYFIGEIKKMEKDIMAEIELFTNRGKITLDMVQAILKWEKDIAKKIKEELISFKNYRQTMLGVDLKGEQQIWGQVSLLQQKIDIERVTYFNKSLLKPEKIQELKKIIVNQQLKNNWQVIVMFLQTKKQNISQIIKAKKSIQNCLRNISYRCWQGIAIAQGWLIQSYTPSVMYMTYDSIMLIYSLEGECLKKIHTSASKINRVDDQIVYLQQKIKGFFTDSIQEYKIKFEQAERMEQFQLFIENQIG